MLSSGLTSPGPGTYSSINLSTKGSYFVSKHPNSGATMFSPPSSKRFNTLTASGKIYIIKISIQLK